MSTGTPRINLWVDDELPAPEGWVRVETVKDAIKALAENSVHDVALDFCLRGGSADEIMWWLIDNPQHKPSGDIVPQSSSERCNELLYELIGKLEGKDG